MRIKAFLALLLGIFVAGAAAGQGYVIPPPPPPLNPEDMIHLDLSNGGRVTLQLRPDVAPKHSERIKILARRGFYDGLTFHRVIEGFMAQGGDPKGDGTGESDLPDLPAEFSNLPHVRGALSAARTEAPDSANSQFFIMLAPRLTLDRKYTVFGRVVAGMTHVDSIERGEPPASPTRIVRASVAADNVAPPPRPVVVQSPAPAAPQTPATPPEPGRAPPAHILPPSQDPARPQ